MIWKSCNIIDWQTDVWYELPIINGGCHDFFYWISIIMFFYLTTVNIVTVPLNSTKIWFCTKNQFMRGKKYSNVPSAWNHFVKKTMFLYILAKNGFGLSDLNNRLKNEYKSYDAMEERVWSHPIYIFCSHENMWICSHRFAKKLCYFPKHLNLVPPCNLSNEITRVYSK